MEGSTVLTRNHVRVFGKGTKPIVFAHGFGCDQQVWSEVVSVFEKEYQVIVFDYVGSGKSDKTAYSPTRYSSLEGYALDLLEVCDALELEKVVLVGHSVSSMIGVLAANKKAALFEKLIMIGPSPCYLNDPPDYYGGFEKEDVDALLNMMEKNYNGWAKYLAPIIMKNEERTSLTEGFEQTLCANDPIIARQFAEVTFLSDVRDELRKVTTPTLILQMRDDAIAPVEVGEYVHAQIKNSRLVLMQASGHNPHMSHPAETAACIQAYLAK
ncbi:alpha/beta fold hydrolase [Domibacillus antri]|uniref:alpha/beta fold hydrolase n=1 Tax=Domibacillus antri TaxID=1714264 RepID=UPI000AE078D7|nr:alpha/beta hydrolase [Domibacillus antri]